MKIEQNQNCTVYPTCDTYSPIALEVTKTANVRKTNTLHQFDFADIIGVPSPVGKVPIVFYVKEGPGRGRRGIVYFNDLDSVCWMYPESEHAEWCRQPYDMKYDKLEEHNNGVERWYDRNWGIFQLWVSVWRKWYNGQVMYKPYKKIQGCGHDFDGYPGKATVEVVKEKTIKRAQQHTPRKQRISHGCGCKKGA